MDSWPRPSIPRVDIPVPELVLHDSLTGQLAPASTSPTFRLYVCGITPYDATHLGHAATYLTFDLVIRVLRAAGKTVTYTQNVTDVDDPLLERADATGQDWRVLAREQTALFRADMEYLGLVPPDHYQAVTDSIPEIGEAIHGLVERGLAYEVASGHPDPDIYLDVWAADRVTPGWDLGSLLRPGASALAEFDAHGGDSGLPGKRDPLDSLLWRGQRPGEPSWQVPGLPAGRPGWHIECAVIAAEAEPLPYDVQGGGADLTYPHHDYSSAQAAAVTGHPLARVFSHVGLVSLGGEKMSKSLGNLVFVRTWRNAGIDPSAIRLAVFSHPYRDPWDWEDTILETATVRLARWRDAVRRGADAVSSDGSAGRKTATRFADALANDLDTVAAWAVLDEWAENPEDTDVVSATVDALTGVSLNH